MTSESVWLLDLTDIRALRVECQKCHATVAVRLDQRDHPAAPPHVCPNCDAPWSHADPQAMAVAKQLAELVRTWHQLQTLHDPSRPSRVSVQLEIAQPPAPSRS